MLRSIQGRIVEGLDFVCTPKTKEDSGESEMQEKRDEMKLIVSGEQKLLTC